MYDPFYTGQTIFPLLEAPGDTPGFYNSGKDLLYTQDLITQPIGPGPNAFIETAFGEVPNKAVIEEQPVKKVVVGMAAGWFILAAISVGVLVSSNNKKRS